jgi:hypothetical protein
MYKETKRASEIKAARSAVANRFVYTIDRPTVCAANDSARMLSYQEVPTSIQWWRGQGQEAKSEEAGGQRLTRHVKR